MHFRSSVDTANHHNLKTIAVSVLLGAVGVVAIFVTANLARIAALQLDTLIETCIATFLAGIPLHEGYHLFTARLLGYHGTINWSPLPKMSVEDETTKWGALGILLAPVMDLSLAAVVILLFLPSFLNPLLALFLVGNLAGSGADVVQSFLILRMADSKCRVRLTQEGFEIWELD